MKLKFTGLTPQPFSYTGDDAVKCNVILQKDNVYHLPSANSDVKRMIAHGQLVACDGTNDKEEVKKTPEQLAKEKELDAAKKALDDAKLLYNGSVANAQKALDAAVKANTGKKANEETAKAEEEAKAALEAATVATTDVDAAQAAYDKLAA